MAKCLYCGEWCTNWHNGGGAIVWVPNQEITKMLMVLCGNCRNTHVVGKITYEDLEIWAASRIESLDGDGTIDDYTLGGNVE